MLQFRKVANKQNQKSWNIHLEMRVFMHVHFNERMDHHVIVPPPVSPRTEVPHRAVRNLLVGHGGPLGSRGSGGLRFKGSFRRGKGS